MNNQQPKNNTIKSIFQQTQFCPFRIQLELKVNAYVLKQKLTHALLELKKEESRNLNPYHQLAVSFIKIIKKAHAVYFIAPAIQEAVEELYLKEFKNIDELKEDIAKLLFRIYFSQGEHKVYDYDDKKIYNDKNCQLLFDKGVCVSDEWLNQLISCLILRSTKEDKKLMLLTPDWLWVKGYNIFFELIQLNNSTTKNPNE
jgi:hypothetical protein